jgi:putative toxin-antitoxin system antitoxin component (TIGR02293 family)
MKTARKAKPAQRKKPPVRATAKSKQSAPKKAAAKPAAKKPRLKPKTPAASGLDFGEFESLRKQLDLSLDELSARLGLSRSTVEERKACGRLTTDESGKLVCYARLLGHAIYLFGGLNEARAWLKTPQHGLHGAVPLDYARTELGAREVENLLTRMGKTET